MNMFKKNGGFTLVELIVVIAILAILAGVAVPAYSGYIKSANEAADITALGAVKTAVMATYATEGTVTKIDFTETGTLKATVGGEEKTVDTTTTTGDFCVFYGGALNLDLKTGSKATWDTASTTNPSEWVISE